MSQQEDDLRALAKIMDFLRAVSIILVVAHLYWYCYEAIRLWGVKEEHITWSKIVVFMGVGFVFFFLNWWILALPLPIEANAALYTFTITVGYHMTYLR